MKDRAFSPKKFLQPKSLIFIFISLAALMFSSALIELRQSKKELLDLMEKQANTLLETVITSSRNALLTYELLEIFLEDRLLNNGFYLRFLLDNQQINNDQLKKFAAENNIHRIDIYEANGSLQYSNMPADLRSKAEAAEQLAPLFSGEQDTLFLGYTLNQDHAGTQFGVALATTDRRAILMTLDAAELLEFRRQIGFGVLLKEMANNQEIVYIALQDTNGIIATSASVLELERISDSPFLTSVMNDTVMKTHLLNFNEEQLFEANHPFYYDDLLVGIFRLGLSLEPLNQIKSRIYRRIAIISLILLVIGFIVVSLIMIRQNYDLLRRQYQTVETYSANIIQNVSDAIIVLDHQHRVKIFNDAAQSLFKVKNSAIVGSSLNEILPDKECGLLLMSSVSMEQVECQIQNETRSFLISRANFFDAQNQQNTILVLRDLTDLKKLEAQIQRKERLTAMGELASGVAHEIRNPLNSISTIVQQLDKDFEPRQNSAEFHQLAQLVIKEVRRINETIQNFLRFARPAPIQLSRFRLAAILNELKQQYAAIIKQQRITLTIQSDWEGEVQWDRLQMYQAFMNLVQNAAEAIDRDGKIQIRVKKIDEKTIKIVVADSGPGIAPEIIGKLFNLYFTTKASGTGIGLSIVQRIIDEHNGVITVENQGDRGAAFELILPINAEG
ncbi:MAG TPA: PAS domain-containing protein [bacterium]|nr:PAS domain-containing protein [bacterium]